MNHSDLLHSPPLILALAAAVGIFAQVCARRVHVPALLVLLGAGVLVGPDGLGIVRPGALGPALLDVVGLAVAVILFEGGMSLSVERVRRSERSIRWLVLLAPLIVAPAATLLAWWWLGWDLRIAALFGTLVIVTGPTVINPLMRRLRIDHRVRTVLEAEGVLTDAVGAIVAVVALEVALRPSVETLAEGALQVVMRLGFGAVFGLAGGAILAFALRRRLIPTGLGNVIVLSFVFLWFESSNAILHESGVAAVTLAGMVVGNVSNPIVRELAHFKEQLTVWLIGLLFVLLAANVRIDSVLSLGWPAVAVVAALVFVVRPLHALVATAGSTLSWRQRAFVAATAPRGIVAAAIAAVFAARLGSEGIAAGAQLAAMVFAVICVTVTWSALTGGVLSRLLEVRRRSGAGYVLLGAGAVGRELAHALDAGPHGTVLIEADPEACRKAEEEGLRCLFGSGLDERVLLRAGIGSRAGAIAVTGEDAVGVLFGQRARHFGAVDRVLTVVRPSHAATTLDLLDEMDGETLFGRPVDISVWSKRMEHDGARTRYYRVDRGGRRGRLCERLPDEGVLPLAVVRGDQVDPVTASTEARAGDEVALVIDPARAVQIEAQLRDAGFVRCPAQLADRAGLGDTATLSAHTDDTARDRVDRTFVVEP